MVMSNRRVEVKRKHIWELFVSMFLVLLMSVAFSVWSANQIVRSESEANRRAAVTSLTPVCQWLYATDDVYSETPPSTETGKKQGASIKNLIITFDCEKFVPRG
jgi:hypothetical protein